MPTPHVAFAALRNGLNSLVKPCAVEQSWPLYFEYVMSYVWCKQRFQIFTLSRCLFFWVALITGGGACLLTVEHMATITVWAGTDSSLLNISLCAASSFFLCYSSSWLRNSLLQADAVVLHRVRSPILASKKKPLSYLFDSCGLFS